MTVRMNIPGVLVALVLAAAQTGWPSENVNTELICDPHFEHGFRVIGPTYLTGKDDGT